VESGGRAGFAATVGEGFDGKFGHDVAAGEIDRMGGGGATERGDEVGDFGFLDDFEMDGEGGDLGGGGAAVVDFGFDDRIGGDGDALDVSSEIAPGGFAAMFAAGGQEAGGGFAAGAEEGAAAGEIGAGGLDIDSMPGVVGGEAKLVEAMDFDSHIDHAVVGLMDPAHGPFVHQQWWWRSEHSMHEKSKRFEPRDLGFAMVRHAPSSNSRAYRILGGAPATEITFRLPGYRWEHIQVGERQVLALTCLTPVTETKTRITQIFWSDHWVFGIAKPFLRMGVVAFLKQDGGMVNLQNEGLRYDPALIWIDDADTQAKWYQQLKRESTKSRAEGRGFVNPVKPAVLRWKS
jgi:hypothetical protein